MLSPFCHFLFGYGYVHNDWVMIRVLKSKISCLNCVDGKIIRNDKSIDHVILEYAWITVITDKWTIQRTAGRCSVVGYKSQVVAKFININDTRCPHIFADERISAVVII